MRSKVLIVHRKKRNFFILFFFVPSLLFAGGRYESPDEDIYTPDVRFDRSYFYARNLLEKYPPDHFVIFGLGRTTGLLSERLRQISQRDDYVVEVPVENIVKIFSYSDQEKTMFFRKIIPSREFLKGRHLVLHRVLWHSVSMSLIGRDLIEFLKKQGYPMPLYSYFITDRDQSKLPLFQVGEFNLFLKNAVVEVVVDSDYQRRFINELDWDTYMMKGPIGKGKFLPVKASEILKKDFSFKLNPSYQRLVREVEEDLKERKNNEDCIGFFEFLPPPYPNLR